MLFDAVTNLIYTSGQECLSELIYILMSILKQHRYILIANSRRKGAEGDSGATRRVSAQGHKRPKTKDESGIGY